MCRVCLSKNCDENEKMSLNTIVNGQETIADLINFCSGVEVIY